MVAYMYDNLKDKTYFIQRRVYMSLIKHFFDIILHLDKYLGSVIHQYGLVTYLILFTIIFCETGLVVIPFLPGDSLIFAAGAFAALHALNIVYLFIILAVAAVLGDTVNYEIGKHLGNKLVAKENSKLFKKEYLDKTHAFYEKHGGKTIIIARFIPIIRTFAPFVAGIGNMEYKKFISYNAIGGISWVALFAFGGFIFGNFPSVKNNFSVVIFAIIFISVLPGVIAYLKGKIKPKNDEIA